MPVGRKGVAVVKDMILDKGGIQRALTEMAHAVLERNRDCANLVIVGIRTRGAYLAERLAKVIQAIEGIEVPVGILDITLHRDDVARRNKLPVVRPTRLPFDIDDRDVILVDDVLFTGRTVRSALNELMDYGRPGTIQLMVLIDRGCRELPIQADYCGVCHPVPLDTRVFVRLKEVDQGEEVVVQKVQP
jgi:pyrimidine operon attenuation protein / uracil phosphoribosyltransferase